MVLKIVTEIIIGVHILVTPKKRGWQGILIARKSALEKTQLSDVLITDNLF